MLNYVIYYVKLCDLVIVLEWYLLSFLMTIIVFLFYYRGELNVNLNLNLNLNLECLDQLIVVVQLPDVSHTNTNGYLYLLWCILPYCKYENIL